MARPRRFVPDPGAGACPSCGSVKGRLIEVETGRCLDSDFCPSPACTGEEALLPGIDPSFLFKARALIFIPDGDQGIPEVGVIRAVKPEDVHDPVLRRSSPVVVDRVSWPEDRAHFSRLFEHHIHHERAPHVTLLNGGWDRSRGLPVL